MPVLDEGGGCVGLIDAESWTPGFFNDARVALVVRCALDVARELQWQESAEGEVGVPVATDRRFFTNGRLVGSRWQPH